jgi:hypothetical protein
MANKFEEKRILAEVLNELYETVDNKEKAIHFEYKRVGTEQARDWRTGELKWEDEEKTVPMMTDKWADVEKEELDEDDKLKIKVYQQIKAQLERMI